MFLFIIVLSSQTKAFKDYNNVLVYFIQVGLLDILKARPQVLIYELTRATAEDKVNDACKKLKARENCTRKLGFILQYMGKISTGKYWFWV